MTPLSLDANACTGVKPKRYSIKVYRRGKVRVEAVQVRMLRDLSHRVAVKGEEKVVVLK